MSKIHKFKAILAEFYRGQTFVSDEYESGDNIDFEGATFSGVNLDGNTMSAADKQAMTTHPVALSELADADYIDLPFSVPEGKSVSVWKWGALTDAQTTPDGLLVGLYDYSTGTYVESQSTPHATGAPLVSSDGAGDYALRLENATGAAHNAGAEFSATIE